MPPSQLLQLTVQHPAQLQHHPAVGLHQSRGCALPLPPSRHSSGSSGWGWPHTCTPGSRACEGKSSPSPLVAFSGRWSSSNKQRCNSLTQRKGHLTTVQRQNNAFHSICLKTCTVHMGFVFRVFFSFSLELMQRRKDKTRTWQKWFLLPDRHCPTRRLQLSICPSLCFSIPVFNKGNWHDFRPLSVVTEELFPLTRNNIFV